MGTKEKDIAAKDFEAFPDVAADIFNALLHKGKKVVCPENLLSAPTETIYHGEGEKRNQMEDLAKYEFCGRELKLVYLLANQTNPDGRMLLRKAGYTGGCYREQYDRKVQETCPVVEIVLYWGEKDWGKARSIRQMFHKKEIPEQTWKYIDNLKLHVWEMRNLPAEVRERFTSDMRIVVDYLAEGETYRSDRKVVHTEALVNMLRSLSGDEYFDDTKLFMEGANIREEDGITMGGLFDQYVLKGMEQGREEGRKEGREEGKQEERLSAVRSVMKELHLTVEEAMKAVGIPQSEWESCQKQIV